MKRERIGFKGKQRNKGNRGIERSNYDRKKRQEREVEKEGDNEKIL